MTRGVRLALTSLAAVVLLGAGGVAVATASPHCASDGCGRTEAVEAFGDLADPATGVCAHVRVTGTLTYTREPVGVLGITRYRDARLGDTTVTTRLTTTCDTDEQPDVRDVVVDQVYGSTRDGVADLADRVVARDPEDEDPALADPLTGDGGAVATSSVLGTLRGTHRAASSGEPRVFPDTWESRVGLADPPCVWIRVTVHLTLVEGDAASSGVVTPLDIAYCAADA